jgi:hypothetical protein
MRLKMSQLAFSAGAEKPCPAPRLRENLLSPLHALNEPQTVQRMEAAGLVISALGFVDLAIKNGTTLARVFRDSSEAGKQVVNATQRLEAQKYTLELWQRTWNKKARQRYKDNLEDGFKDL